MGRARPLRSIEPEIIGQSVLLCDVNLFETKEASEGLKAGLQGRDILLDLYMYIYIAKRLNPKSSRRSTSLSSRMSKIYPWLFNGCLNLPYISREYVSYGP